MSWIDIGDIEDIPLRGSRKVKTRDGCIAVFRTDVATVFATSNVCPHKQGPLNEGIVHGNKVTCPLHNWVISLETGLVQGPDEGQVATYPARVEEGRIHIDAALLASRSAA